MLQKPDLPDERLVARLTEAYGLRAAQVAFLPLGADVNTAVYRVEAGDSQAYFVKLRRGPLDEMSVALPAFLGGEGIRPVIAPVRTTARQLWCELENYTLTVYPFVEGVDGYAVTLSQGQWVEFGAALKRIHTARLPPEMRRGLPAETYSPQWREQVRSFLSRLRAGTFEDPVTAELAAIVRGRAAVIAQLVKAADRLAQQLQGRPQERILCHADLHAGNLLIGKDGSLHLVDWDTALLAPKERDLMFVGSGLGPGWNEAQTADWFYQGYGPAEIDLAGLAYYRCERVVQDIAAFCEQILSATDDGPDRRQAILYLLSQFRPNGVVEIARRSCLAAGAAGRP